MNKRTLVTLLVIAAALALFVYLGHKAKKPLPSASLDLTETEASDLTQAAGAPLKDSGTLAEVVPLPDMPKIYDAPVSKTSVAKNLVTSPVSPRIPKVYSRPIQGFSSPPVADTTGAAHQSIVNLVRKIDSAGTGKAAYNTQLSRMVQQARVHQQILTEIKEMEAQGDADNPPQSA